MKINKKYDQEISIDRIIKKLKRLQSYDVKKDDTIYLNKRILYGKQLIDFLDNFD